MGETQTKTTSGIEQNLAGLLCYVLGWLTGLFFYITEKQNEFIRFHAMQSILIFGGLTVVEIILSFIPIVGWILGMLLGIAAFILWLYLMLNAYRGKKIKMPIAGDIAERQSKATQSS